MRSRVRESLFAMIGDRIVGSRVLDVFAGSGALAMEAISRGARRATLVERDSKVIALIQKNLRTLGLEAQCEVLAADAYRLFDKHPPEEPFDIVLLDPPFPDFARAPDRTPWQLARRLGAEFLAENGVIAIEHPTRGPVSTPPEGLEGLKAHRYGETSLTLWQRISG